MKKPKATQNTAKDVETKTKIEKLYADLGRITIAMENLQGQLNQAAKARRNIWQKIQKLEGK